MNYEWILTDFEKALPAEKRSRVSRKGVWHVTDYTTEEFAGTLILANPNADAPEIRIKLPLKGTYEIVLGLAENYCDRLCVKLGSDRTYDRVCHSWDMYKNGMAFQDTVWRTAQLDGNEELLIKQDKGIRASVGYVYLRKPETPNVKDSKKFMIHITDDGWPSNWGIIDDKEERFWVIDNYKRSSADFISFGVNALGMANYATKHDSLRIDVKERLKEEFAHDVYKEAYVIIDRDIREGFVVPKRYFEITKQNGITGLAYSRMGLSSCPPPYSDFRSRLYDEHPEWRSIDIDGIPVNRMSYAYPEVRQEVIKLFAECVELGADGISDVYNRGFPMVCYEEPVKRRFRELYGDDITKYPENDMKAQAVRAEFVTTFMREQRIAMDIAGGGRKITILATCLSDRESCEFHGMDVKRWAQEGLIDVLCPYPWSKDAKRVDIDIEYFCDAVKGTKVKLLPFINAPYDERTPVGFLKTALKFSKHPIDGLSVWDQQLEHTYQFAIRNLGSPERMEWAVEKLKNMPAYKPLVLLEGTKANKYNYGWNL